MGEKRQKKRKKQKERRGEWIGSSRLGGVLQLLFSAGHKTKAPSTCLPLIYLLLQTSVIGFFGSARQGLVFAAFFRGLTPSFFALTVPCVPLRDYTGEREAR